MLYGHTIQPVSLIKNTFIIMKKTSRSQLIAQKTIFATFNILKKLRRKHLFFPHSKNGLSPDLSIYDEVTLDY